MGVFGSGRVLGLAVGDATLEQGVHGVSANRALLNMVFPKIEHS